MAEVWFYQLTRTPLEEALVPLLQRSLAQGWRVEVRGRARERMVALDAALWLSGRDLFLPHGIAGGAHDALQPVLLTTQPAGQVFGCLIALDGVDVGQDEVAALARVSILFDGADPDATERARAQWRSLTEAGLGAKYWAEDGGRWTMKHERAASG